MLRRFYIAFAIFVLAALAHACTDNIGGNGTSGTAHAAEPSIEASPVEKGEDKWQVTASDKITFKVEAPGAEKVKIFYRPVIANDESFVELREINRSTESDKNVFTTEVDMPEDFAGEVWARAAYSDGASKNSPEIALTTKDEGANQVSRKASNDKSSSSNANSSEGDSTAKTQRSDADANKDDRRISSEASGKTPAQQTADNHESARSDKFTGGKIETASLKKSQGDVRITVNVPAFTLTLWQDGKEIKTYPVGVGRKNFPIPTGMRDANQIIFNPAWIPPDSSWVHSASNVEPYERIEADDPRNPLGKIKFPLGGGYLLHEAAKPSDIGNLVSHGCVRILTDDIFDLAEKIIEARGLSITTEEISRLRSNKERRAVKFDEPLSVDVNYDTLVVEGGSLHVYPDVYERGTNTVANLREELEAHGLDASKLDDQTIREMLERANGSNSFVVKLSDIEKGRALDGGSEKPLPGHG